MQFVHVECYLIQATDRARTNPQSHFIFNIFCAASLPESASDKLCYLLLKKEKCMYTEMYFAPKKSPAAPRIGCF